HYVSRGLCYKNGRRLRSERKSPRQFAQRKFEGGKKMTIQAKRRVGILGATGTVGQRLIHMLRNHPYFEVTALAASDRSEGKRFAEVCAWKLPFEMPGVVKEIKVFGCKPPLDCDVVISSLPSDIAVESEAAFAAAGFPVISNSSSYR